VFAVNCSKGDVIMKKINNIKYQIISLILFAVYFISLLPAWFSVEGVKNVSGTLILSALFPLGITAAASFSIINLISIIKTNKLYMHLINIIFLITLLILSARLLLNWGGFSKNISFWFYFSNTALIFSFIFYIINMCKMNKTTNVKINGRSNS